MEVTYQCNLDDYLEAQRAHYRKTHAFIMFFILGGLLLVFAIWKLFTAGIASAVPALLLGVLWVLMPRLLFRRKRLKRDFDRHPHLSKTCILRIADDGVSVTNDVSNSENKWGLYTNFRETKNLFMLYQGSRLFEMVPKRAFGTADLAQFRSLLNQKIPSIAG